jgi:predicted secreted Zn-dependent protease
VDGWCTSRGWISALLAAILALSIPVFPALAAPEYSITVDGVGVFTSYAYYDVGGSSISDLASQISQLGPRENGTRWAAATTWSLDWRYAHLATDNTCRALNPTVTVNVTFALPRWAAAASASPIATSAWYAFSDAVLHHEQGHRDLAIEAGNELLAALWRQPAAASCAEYDLGVRALVQGIVEDYQSRQTEYDLWTGHGVAQGAVLR